MTRFFAGNVIAGIAGFLCATSFFSSFRASDSGIKSFTFSLGILTAGIAGGSFAAAFLSEDQLTGLLNQEKSLYERELKTEKDRAKKLESQVSDKHRAFLQVQQEKEARENELNKQVEKEQQYRVREAQLAVLVKDLNDALAKRDTRYEETTLQLQSSFWEITRERIDTDYERMGNVVETRINSDDFILIREQLERFFDNLYVSHARHCELLDEIEALDTTSPDFAKEVTTIFFTVSDQTTALKVKLRNLLNLDERKALDQALEELVIKRDPKLFVPAQKVRSALDMYRDHNTESIEKIEQSYLQNKAGYEELCNQVQDLLAALETKALEILTLKDEIAVLKLPRQFSGGSSIPKSGNAVINYYFGRYSIKLDGVHWQETDTGYTLTFSIRHNPSVTKDDFYADNSREQLASFTNALYKTMPEFDIDYQQGLAVLTVMLRRAVQKETHASDIYKEGLIPASLFCDQLYKALDHTSQGKPTMRVMASTGEGKGIALKNLLSFWVALPEWEVWLSDPMDGSEEDYWDCPKVATSAQEAAKAYSQFVELHRLRKNKQPTWTPYYILAIFDEFDKQHGDDDKDDAKNIMTALRHTNQRQILVGQCAEVGANRWTWGDMTNCALLALGDSIGIVAKHLVKDMGWTLAKANKLKKEHEKFATWAEKHNQSEEIPNENRYRIALLIVGSRYSFLEVPSAYKGIIRNDKATIRDSLSRNTQNAVFSNNSNGYSKERETISTASQITCPHCGSHQAHKHSAVKDERNYRYICLNSECKKTFIAARFF